MQSTALTVNPNLCSLRTPPRGFASYRQFPGVNPTRRSSAFSIAASAAVEQESDEIQQVLDVNRSYYPKKIDTSPVAKPWYLIDAEGQVLGRLACLVAVMIRGKLNPAYTPSMDMGAFIVVVNAAKVTVSGKKYTDKVYFKHTQGRPGKYRQESFKTLQNRIPERIIEKAVKGMLPKGRLGRSLNTHLKIYANEEHPHEAQKPIDITSLIDAKPKEYAKLLSS